MSSSQARLDLLIDVFDLVAQPASVLPKIKPPQLIEAIVQEFREIQYLADDPEQYYLTRADDETPLDDGVELNRQPLAPGAHLVLHERILAAPAGAQPFSRRVYLREQKLGKVYRLNWQPAIIGRRAESPSQGDAQPVTVDLQPFPSGLRVSRRHLSIDELDGQVTVENLSNNPAFVQRTGGVQLPIKTEKIPLQDDDIIMLERSQIAFKVLFLPQARRGAAEITAATADPEAENPNLQATSASVVAEAS